MTGKVNYIKHLQAIKMLFEQDDRLSPWHVSLYIALFHCWNDNKLQNPVSINRQEVMRLSKIGSVNTYTKALKQLHEWEYICYEPSNNPWIGSLVHLYRYDNSRSITTSKTTSKSISKRNNNTPETVPETLVRPSLKDIKNNKDLKGLKGVKVKSQFAPPTIEELNSFFLSEGSYASEAENFFNYFQSNGWLVGGKAKMKDWQAAARNWIKRSANFQKPEKKNYLNVNHDKDYSIPL